MNPLPVVRITSEGGGWVATCSCRWLQWDAARHVIDKAAHEHRAKCKPKGEKARG